MLGCSNGHQKIKTQAPLEEESRVRRSSDCGELDLEWEEKERQRTRAGTEEKLRAVRSLEENYDAPVQRVTVKRYRELN